MAIDPKLESDLAKWKSLESGPFFEISDTEKSVIGSVVPSNYIDAVRKFGGREGFLGNCYLRLYQLQELIALNLSYEVPEYAPEVFVFGSNGGGEAFAFLIQSGQVVRIPFIPLTIENAIVVGNTFLDFVGKLAQTGASRELNPTTVGVEVHDLQPVVFGGSPTDAKNKVLVPPLAHAELARFWNKTYRCLRNEQKRTS